MISVGILIGLLVVLAAVPYVVSLVGEALGYLNRDVLEEVESEWEEYESLRRLTPHPDRRNVWTRQ